MIYRLKILFIVIVLISSAWTISSCIGISAPPSIISTPSPPEISAPLPPEPDSSTLVVPPSIDSSVTMQNTHESTEEISRHYNWEYERKEYRLDLIIPSSLYSYYKELPRLPTKNYSVYITHPQDDIYIQEIVEAIEKTAKAKDFDELKQIEFTAAFVQNLSYTLDSTSTSYDEYPRYPIETLVDKGGDCEDKSILLASLLNSLGHNTALIIFPGRHCALGVSINDGIDGVYFESNGERYFYLETTTIGWEVGQIPDEVNGITANIYDMTPIPIFVCNWNATIRGNIAELTISVKNVGTESADDIYILAGFDTGGDEIWNSNETETFDLPINHNVNISATLKVPDIQHIRLVVQIIDDSCAVDQSYSAWFDE